MKLTARKKAIAFATSAAVEYKQLLRQYLRRRLRRPDDLDDLAQEVYLRLLHMPDETQIARVREPMAYVYGVAANVVADWYRTADRCTDHSVSLETAEREIEESPGKTPDDDPVERIARQQHVRRVFDQLPPIQATVLLLHVRDGLSYQQIATKLNVSTYMVNYHLTKAKARIRLTPWER